MAFLYYNYSAPINVRQSTTSAANTTIWAMRNDLNSTKTIYIDHIEINMSFDAGTPLGRSLQRYDFVRFSSATPTGGSSITAVPNDSTAPSTQITDIRSVDTGLTTSGISFGTPIITVGVPATDSAVVNYQSSDIPIILGAGEGFCIRLTNTAVAGQGMTGFITWSDR